MATPAEVYESLRQAHAQADPDAAAALYAPDGVYHDPDGTPHKGRDEIRTHLAAYFARRGPVDVTVKRQVAGDGSLLSEWTSAFTEAGRRSTGTPGATVVELGREGIAYHRDYQ